MGRRELRIVELRLRVDHRRSKVMAQPERMSDFVVSDSPLFLFFQPAALAFRSGHDFFHGFFHVFLTDFASMPAGRQQRSFIDRIRQIRA